MHNIDNNSFFANTKHKMIGDSEAWCHIDIDDDKMFEMRQVDEQVQGSLGILKLQMMDQCFWWYDR